MTITQEQFEAYEDVRQNGITNMYDSIAVQVLSGLSQPEIKAIMADYSALRERYQGGIK
jgi:hypothetical protein